MNYDRIIQGDCLEGMAQMDGSSVDLVVTDPPYGYSFMGKDWDKAVPSVDVWKECLRVLKPGAFAFIMSAPRLDVLTQMSVRVQEAGFDVAFTPLYWAYASGFPKAQNMSKAVDKRLGAEREITGRNNNYRPISGTSGYLGETTFRQTENMRYEKDIPASPQPKALNGSYGGFQPKPAVEVIIVAMKPLSEKTYIDQALANGKGITWLDDGRIPYQSDDDIIAKNPHTLSKGSEAYDSNCYGKYDGANYIPPNDGRFPANLLVSDDVLDNGTITKAKRATMDGGFGRGINTFGAGLITSERGFNDSGGFSRYFSLDKWAEQLPFLIVPKASKSEKNKGLDGMPLKQNIGGGGTYNAECANKFGSVDSPSQNFHPTVKPLKLMSYLISIGSRVDDLVLDPFAGSGTVGIAARKLARHFIGFELSEQYHEISVARTRDAIAQRSLIDFGEEVNDYRHKTPTKGQVKE